MGSVHSSGGRSPLGNMRVARRCRGVARRRGTSGICSKNELESIGRAGIADLLIEIDDRDVNGLRKPRITGNRAGMTPEEVADNLHRLSASGGITEWDTRVWTQGTKGPQRTERARR